MWAAALVFHDLNDHSSGAGLATSGLKAPPLQAGQLARTPRWPLSQMAVSWGEKKNMGKKQKKNITDMHNLVNNTEFHFETWGWFIFSLPTLFQGSFYWLPCLLLEHLKEIESNFSSHLRLIMYQMHKQITQTAQWVFRSNWPTRVINYTIQAIMQSPTVKTQHWNVSHRGGKTHLLWEMFVVDKGWLVYFPSLQTILISLKVKH